MDRYALHQAARPFFYAGNEIGCLVSHGLTATPDSVRWLGQHLHQQGYTVYGPRLSGHGARTKDLTHVRWQAWYHDLYAGYLLLREKCDTIFIAGLSMGGALTLLLASQVEIAGFIAMAAPHKIDHPIAPYMRLLNRIISYLPKNLPDPADDLFQHYVKAEQHRRGEAPIGYIAYDAWATASLYQLRRFLSIMRAGLPAITAPGVLIYSEADETVALENMNLNFDLIGSEDKQTLVLEKSNHILTQHIEHELVFNTITNFIKAHV